jgi:DNA-binding winged helix-turn-helix (wHTH) protein/predicted negative regulator of RcsB-dependent stress response
VPTLEIDAQRRELRAGGRELSPQPKVFDLLRFLFDNRQRVVPKRELLEAVWPDAVVTDASLQRAISLARSALSELGVPADAIRTHARQGYRFCLDESSAAVAPVSELQPDVLQRARAAYERGEWAEAISLLGTVDDLEGLGADDLQRWAHAAQCLGHPGEALPVLERAVAAYSTRGDQRRAAWAAILSAQLRLEWRESALANGWVQRAARLLEGDPGCREQGYLELLRARLALGANQLEQALLHSLRTRELGRTFDDPDLEHLGLALAGQAWLFTGKTHEGLNALDEAAVAVGSCGLSSWAGGLVYCGVIYCYMTRSDWQRAGQWTEQYTRWCEGRGVAAYPGLCRMHRAEVLCVKGQLGEAVNEMAATLDMLAATAPWVCGDAWCVMGDILLSRGSLAEARAAYLRSAELGWDSTLGLALVRFHEGDAPGALRQLAQCIDEQGFSCRSKRGSALIHVALVATAAGELEQARAALATLSQDPLLASTPALEALIGRARGELAAAQGDQLGAVRHFRGALRLCHALSAPVESGEIRRALARVLLAQGDVEGAEIELGAAMRLFQQAGADGQLARCEPLREAIRSQRAESPALP